MTPPRSKDTIVTTSRDSSTTTPLWDLLPVRLSPAGRRSFRALKAHGAGLQAVARMLTDDPELAARLVVRAILTGSTTGPDPDLRELSAFLVSQWISDVAVHGWSAPGIGHATTAPVLQEVHRLPGDQRALLALCKFGAHTYREAAAVLNIQAGAAAALLGEAMRALVTPLPADDSVSVTS